MILVWQQRITQQKLHTNKLKVLFKGVSQKLELIPKKTLIHKIDGLFWLIKKLQDQELFQMFPISRIQSSHGSKFLLEYEHLHQLNHLDLTVVLSNKVQAKNFLELGMFLHSRNK